MLGTAMALVARARPERIGTLRGPVSSLVEAVGLAARLVGSWD
jgi:hypothetical protein